ncbi:MAG: hypothetical protein KTV77_03240 [Wolbachia endosymbiont of Fragariocoptes setiger]|nr:hypothetical protein [Wolbachia endosymbiont of Fragariocoptes setiger]
MKKNNQGSQGSSQGSSSSKYDDIEKYPPGGALTGPIDPSKYDKSRNTSEVVRKMMEEARKSREEARRNKEELGKKGFSR